VTRPPATCSRLRGLKSRRPRPLGAAATSDGAGGESSRCRRAGMTTGYDRDPREGNRIVTSKVTEVNTVWPSSVRNVTDVRSILT
jgi:hypothetical protein